MNDDANRDGKILPFTRGRRSSHERYDARSEDYHEKGHPCDPEARSVRWTDILGACWNYRRREDDPHPEEHALELFLQHIRPF